MFFLPANFGWGLKSLEFLDLSHNQLHALPDNLFENDHVGAALQVLLIDHNGLKRLPSNLGNLEVREKLNWNFEISQLSVTLD
jgi:Leucine-rich repeat (LRR) protein